MINLESSWAEPDIPNQLGLSTGITIHGEDGIIKIDPSKYSAEKLTELDGGEPAFEEFDQLPYFVEQVEAFINCILTDESSPIPIEEGIRSLRVAVAAVESLNSGKVIRLNGKY